MIRVNSSFHESLVQLMPLRLGLNISLCVNHMFMFSSVFIPMNVSETANCTVLTQIYPMNTATPRIVRLQWSRF